MLCPVSVVVASKSTAAMHVASFISYSNQSASPQPAHSVISRTHSSIASCVVHRWCNVSLERDSVSRYTRLFMLRIVSTTSPIFSLSPFPSSVHLNGAVSGSHSFRWEAVASKPPPPYPPWARAISSILLRTADRSWKGHEVKRL